jgi:dolichol kinase
VIKTDLHPIVVFCFGFVSCAMGLILGHRATETEDAKEKKTVGPSLAGIVTTLVVFTLLMALFSGSPSLN